MTRHFLGLFLLIVATLAAASWAQDRLLAHLDRSETPEELALKLACASLKTELAGVPASEWRARVMAWAEGSGLALELFDKADIAGDGTLERLAHGETVHMQGSAGEAWAFRRLDAEHVLALKSSLGGARNGTDWLITAAFYALIALVLMLWIWPLRRDFSRLERAVAHFGDRNWRFDADISPRSQIFGLASTFRRMAARIEDLIVSHKDMSNALAHEIKTPLSRMHFELEFAERAQDLETVRGSLQHVQEDVAAINRLVRAALEYAILERAELELNLGAHDFTTIIPSIAEIVARDCQRRVRIEVDVQPEAREIRCDVQLFEAILKNLLYNGCRYAKTAVKVRFRFDASSNRLIVEDDGPGIDAKEQERVFGAFVKLDRSKTNQNGFGLGLAIVKRAIEWHGGEVALSRSEGGGARFELHWPADG